MEKIIKTSLKEDYNEVSFSYGIEKDLTIEINGHKAVINTDQIPDFVEFMNNCFKEKKPYRMIIVEGGLE